MKNTNSKIVIVPDYGKVPPQAVDAEKTVIGTCLININAIDNIISVLQPEMFYLESHQKIFASIISLNNRGITPDLISLSDRLRTDNELDSVGGPLYLAQLTEYVFTETVLIHHARLIKEKWLLREYIRCGNQMSGMAYTEDLADVVEYAESTIVNISNFTQNKDPKRIDRCVDEYLIEIEKIINKEKKLSGVPSGFTTMDRITGGWQD
jgi:replicative DNA helicase